MPRLRSGKKIESTPLNSPVGGIKKKGKRTLLPLSSKEQIKKNQDDSWSFSLDEEESDDDDVSSLEDNEKGVQEEEEKTETLAKRAPSFTVEAVTAKTNQKIGATMKRRRVKERSKERRPLRAG